MIVCCHKPLAEKTTQQKSKAFQFANMICINADSGKIHLADMQTENA